MKAEVTTLENKKAGTIELSDEVFGLPSRRDILHRVVNWQLAKRRAGTHKVKERGEIRGSTAKIWKQKGTGRARHSTRKVNIFRGGGVAHGPVVRSHEHKLPKKIRVLGLKTALSAKQAAGELLILESAQLESGKTKLLKNKIETMGVKSLLIIDGPEIDRNLQLAARNLPNVQILRSVGANVYDILRVQNLAITKSAVKSLEERLR